MGEVEVVQVHRASFETLYEAESPRVLRLCRLLLGDPEEAAEVWQDVFVKLHEAQCREPQPVNWGAWLTRVAVNACHDRRRSGWWKWWKRACEVFGDGIAPSRGLTPEEAAVSADARERIWHAFRGLSPRQREAFVLRHIEGWTTEAVARALCVSTGSVKRHLFRAVRHLRRELGDSR